MKSLIETTVISAATAALLIAGPVFSEDKHHEQRLQQMSEDAQRYFHNGWQEGKIETAILFNENLNNFKVDVEVNQGKAILAGDVPSGIEKDLAEQIALSVDGIQSVENQLVINPEAEKGEDTAQDSGFLSTVEDASISAQVKMKLLANEFIEGMDINVDTKDKVVTLDGNVKTDAEKDLAEKIVENIESVASVKNELKVVRG